VTLALPEDVQAEAWDFPAQLFEKRVWHVGRSVPEAGELARAAAILKNAKRPLIVAGGGVIYSEATQALRAFAENTGIPVGETQAGKGSLPWDHTDCLGAIGSTGTLPANRLAKQADVILGIGTRYSDFTTQSHTLFQHPDVKFVNLNVADLDAVKLGAATLRADARAGLEALTVAVAGYRVPAAYEQEVRALNAEWHAEVDRVFAPRNEPKLAQGEVLGALDRTLGPKDVVICAAGSLPGDLHKLWRTRDPKGYHLEYGYSCMGYEIAAGLGVKLAAPEREVFVLVGDGSYLMMAQELVTAVQEGIRFTVILVDNHGYGSIGALSESLGSGGFGTRYRKRAGGNGHTGDVLPLDFVGNARSLGVHAERANTLDELTTAIASAKSRAVPSVIVLETDPTVRVPGYDSWWDVPVAEVSESASVRDARANWETQSKRRRTHL
jgi:3D-(3,5/4)-trihydroxycyclohexane-1,2-dione acylhydrolase (decyclizing)